MGHTWRVFRRKFNHQVWGTARVHVGDGFDLHVHRSGDEIITPMLVDAGIWEPEETQVLLTLLRPGDVFVDIGANIGYYSVLAARAVGRQGRVFAIEPAPRNFRLLQRNLADNRCTQARAFAVALGARHGGHITLHLSTDNAGDHRIAEVRQEPSRHRVNVPLTTLDRLLPTTRVDLIKMDTQGAEARILKGMHTVLANNPRLTLITEFWPEGLQSAGTDALQYLQALRSFGFRAQLLLDQASGRNAESAEQLLEDVTFAQVLEICEVRDYVNLVLRRG